MVTSYSYGVLICLFYSKYCSMARGHTHLKPVLSSVHGLPLISYGELKVETAPKTCWYILVTMMGMCRECFPCLLSSVMTYY
jgi:hypothetical protein